MARTIAIIVTWTNRIKLLLCELYAKYAYITCNYSAITLQKFL